MTAQSTGLWTTMVTLSVGLLIGVGAAVWLTPRSPLQETDVNADSQHDHRLGQLEQAVTALTQAVQNSRAKSVSSGPIRGTGPANGEVSRQSLAQLIRDEIRQAVADASPEAQRAREEALAEAELLNSPENREAFQSASDVVQAAVAAKRWTEEDKEAFREAFGLLTNEQRIELMNVLAPAINRGEVKVEVRGPLF